MHIMDDTKGMVIIAVVSLRFENKEREEVRVRPKGFQAVDYISCIELKGLASNDNLMALEGWTARQKGIDNLVKFISVLE